MNPNQTPPTPSASSGASHCQPDWIESNTQLMALACAALAPIAVKGAHFGTLPPGYQRVDLTDAIEKAQPAPLRKRGSTQLSDVASLLAYCADQKASDTAYLYADPDAKTITAVFNDQKGGAGWRDHRAIFKAEHTPEFALWMSNNGQSRQKTQSEFAEFIEDNVADITDPAAGKLLEIATTIQATTGINFATAKRLQDGQTQLTYTENVEARAGINGALSIPKEFALGLRIFKNGEGYKLTARLKFRLGGGTIKFWYELERPERAVEDAFAGYVEKVRESGYTVLLGKAG